MRFRPAYIHRRVCSSAFISPAFPKQNLLKVQQQERVPAPPPVDSSRHARTLSRRAAPAGTLHRLLHTSKTIRTQSGASRL